MYNYYLHRDYDRLVVLHYTLAGSDLSYISIPFRLTLPADCPCDGSPPTIGCCEVECDTEE